MRDIRGAKLMGSLRPIRNAEKDGPLKLGGLPTLLLMRHQSITSIGTIRH